MKPNVKIVTQSDIAKKLGTSVNTVSRALRNCSDIGDEMKEKVRLIADEMGYTPNRMASFMRTQKSNVIAVVISSLRNPFFSIVLDYLFTYLKEKQYSPLIFVKNDTSLTVTDIIRCILSGACGVFTFVDMESATVDYCENNEIPLLLCGSSPCDERVSAVWLDDYRCGALVAREAIELGCKRACYINITAPALAHLNDVRRSGFVDELSKAGIPCDDIIYTGSAPGAIDKIKAAALANGDDFIFCFNDAIAVEMLTVFGGDASMESRIFGVDGISKYLAYSRNVNSVGGNLKEIAECCGRILIHKIETDDEEVFRKIYSAEIIKNQP